MIDDGEITQQEGQTNKIKEIKENWDKHSKTSTALITKANIKVTKK